jgi:hypothetical protein
MAEAEFDNRVKFPPTEIDFDNDVGVTGQFHDEHPAPGQQPRYDWMRLTLIGLLSCQSSSEPPEQYRTGTIWYNRLESKYMMYDGAAWVDIALHIKLGSTTLYQFYIDATEKLSRIQPRFTYSGMISTDAVIKIPIPESIQIQLSGIALLFRALVFINGVLIDPRLCTFPSGCPVHIDISPSVNLQASDKFTVIIERFDVFIEEDIIA